MIITAFRSALNSKNLVIGKADLVAQSESFYVRKRRRGLSIDNRQLALLLAREAIVDS